MIKLMELPFNDHTVQKVGHAAQFLGNRLKLTAWGCWRDIHGELVFFLGKSAVVTAVTQNTITAIVDGDQIVLKPHDNALISFFMEQ